MIGGGNGIAARGMALAARLLLARYLVASLLALCVDMGLFLALTWAGLAPGWAAMLGYGGGIVMHWLLSVRFVFSVTTARRPLRLLRLQFLLSALLGLAITGWLVSLLTAMDMAPAGAKGTAVLASFIAVYLVRKHVVFGLR